MGKTKYIETPERMWELFCSYRKSLKEKPILVKDWVGKDGDQINREKERPLTMEGFENYLFTKGVITDVSDYFENKGGRYADYIPICRLIKRNIRQDQIEGGMAGIYNPSITQRLNGLKESVEESGSKEMVIRVKYENRGENSSPASAPSGPVQDNE
jgi:hypothetical protein